MGCAPCSYDGHKHYCESNRTERRHQIAVETAHAKVHSAQDSGRLVIQRWFDVEKSADHEPAADGKTAQDHECEDRDGGIDSQDDYSRQRRSRRYTNSDESAE